MSGYISAGVARLQGLLLAIGGAAMVGFQALGIGSVSRTVQHRLQDLPTARDFGAVSDGVTDDTAACIVAANAGHKVVVMPPNTKFDTEALIAAMPVGVLFLDLSSINDLSAPGETTKRVGIISKDTATSDTHFAMLSGHHVVLQLNNTGQAGTVSGDEGKATIAWCRGLFKLGPLNKRGFRPVAFLQWTKESFGDFWVAQLRSQAPWLAANAKYEYWAAGEVVIAGKYRATGDRHYVSTTGGTCAAPEPSHDDGIAADGGGVLWQYVDSTDRTVLSIDQYGRVLAGQGSYDATFNHRTTKTDPLGGAYAMHLRATGVSKISQVRLTPTDGAGAESLQPFLRGEHGVGLRVLNAAGSAEIARFSDKVLHVTAQGLAVAVAANADATPTVAGVSGLWLQNPSAQNLTGFDDHEPGQFLRLYFGTALNTLVASAGLQLVGGVNVTPSAGSVIDLQRMPASLSAAWWEVSRNIK